MTERMQVYKCEICGNIVEVMHPGKGELVCCGQPMTLLKEKTADSSTEKHVPFIKREGNAYIVKVGENTPHPMEENHYIEWIEIVADGRNYKKFLNPEDKPEVEFEIKDEKVEARACCNIHGLWKS
ncbi:MAG: desulfoferrodoxin [Caldisericota bacterium]|nr:desulfoferrodoxin [Caldisericota bacterium]